VAYESDESGRWEVYIRPFPEGKGRWPVSINGGESPRWSGQASELFYVKADTLMAVSIETEGEINIGVPHALFAGTSVRARELEIRNYDVSMDGRRFVVVQNVEVDQTPTITVVQNWYAEFKEP
jgi:serine/threonine-protein kinase